MKTILIASLLGSGLLTAAPAGPDWQKAADQAEELIAKSRRLDGRQHALKAREVLAPWWNAEELPDKIRLQRATLLQRDHHFDEALVDLNVLLKKNPKLTEAWLMKSTILTVAGRYREARQAAIPLFGLASPLLALTAGTAPTSCHGNLKESFRILHQAVEAHDDETDGIRAWAHTALAEMAVRLGKTDEAGEHFRSALRIDPHSPYLLKNYAHYLLEHDWVEKAAEILHPYRDSLPVAWMKVRQAQGASPDEMSELATNYEASLVLQQVRHGHTHGRDEAVFYLEIKKDPREALHQAVGNWESQREAADLLILIKSALAAEDQSTLAEVWEWIDDHQFEDVRLQALLAAPETS